MGGPSAYYNPAGIDRIINDGDTTPSATQGTYFGSRSVGSPLTRDFYIRNSSSAEDVLRIRNPRLTGSGASSFQIIGLGTSNLSKGNNRNFEIRFNPTSAGTKTATFTFDNNDENEGGGEPYEATYSFTLPGAGNEAQREFRITNSGNVPLNIEGATTFTGPAAADYDISGLFAGNPFVNIAPGESQAFTVTFNPSTTGVRNAVISIANNDPDEDPYTFALTGVGIGSPEIRVQARRDVVGTFLTQINDGDNTPRSNDGTLFADTDVGSSRETLIRIHNDGDGELEVGNRTFSGANANQFATAGFPAENSISPGSSADFRIRFTPTSFGMKTAVISFVTNDSNENPFNFTIRGLAETPDLDVFGGPNINTAIADEDNSPSPTDYTDFAEANPSNEIITRSFKLTNGGNVPLEFTSISISNEANFSVASDLEFGDEIAPGSFNSREFTVSFDPSQEGVEFALVTIRTNDPDEEPYTFRVTGTGSSSTSDPDLQIRGGSGFTRIISAGDSTPSTLDGTDFGTVMQRSTPVTRTFQMRNRGGANLINIQGASGNPAATVTGVNSSLAPELNDSFTVSFDPSQPGLQTAIIGILSNDPNEAPYLFSVQLEVTPSDDTPPAITSFNLSPGNGSATFDTIPGSTYRLTISTSLEGNWVQVPGTGTITGDGNPASITFTPAPSADIKRFYRLERE